MFIKYRDFKMYNEIGIVSDENIPIVVYFEKKEMGVGSVGYYARGKVNGKIMKKVKKPFYGESVEKDLEYFKQSDDSIIEFCRDLMKEYFEGKTKQK